MRLRNITATVLAAGATLPLAGIANAQPDRDCPDFSSQAEAKEALDSVPGDPERLDSDGDAELRLITCGGESAHGGTYSTRSRPHPAAPLEYRHRRQAGVVVGPRHE
jgi:hypothetical protein